MLMDEISECGVRRAAGARFFLPFPGLLVSQQSLGSMIHIT